MAFSISLHIEHIVLALTLRQSLVGLNMPHGCIVIVDSHVALGKVCMCFHLTLSALVCLKWLKVEPEIAP
jgi:uncharacterized Tic20 family protein